VFENSTRLHLDDCDAIIVHDPQPLPLITHFVDRETRVAVNLAVSQSSATTSAMGWLLNLFFLSGRGDWRARAGRRWPW
jgi:trehalose synthase